MSRSGEAASDGEQDAAGRDSIYDFLYHDSQRVGAFLSQFDNNGLLKSIHKEETATEVRSPQRHAAFEASVPTLLKVSAGYERGVSEGGTEALSRSYDPFWTNALVFLDRLEEFNLVHTNIEEAKLGQFVLMKGQLSILDQSLMKEMWKLPTIKRHIKQMEDDEPDPGNRRERRANESRKRKTKSGPSAAELTLELLPILPHIVHATMIEGQNTSVWAPLRRDDMVTPPAEIFLTHGYIVHGEWAMLGILNARPDYGSASVLERLVEIQNGLPIGLIESGLGTMVMRMASPMRQTFGRPEGAYGVTPLLIFREVA